MNKVLNILTRRPFLGWKNGMMKKTNPVVTKKITPDSLNFEKEEKKNTFTNEYSLEEEVNKLYVVTIHNGVIKEGLEGEWQQYLNNTITSFNDIPLIEELIRELFILARVPQKLLNEKIKNFPYLDSLIYFSINGGLVRNYLGIKDNLKLAMIPN